MSRVNPTLPSSSSELSMSKDRSFKSYSEKVCYKDEEKFKRSVQFDDRSPEIIREPYHDDDGTNFPLEDDYDCKTITLRSSLVGLLMAILGASVAQLFVFKPVHMRLQPTFIQISCMLIGRAFAKVPGGEWWNPGPFSIKESTFSGIVATSAGAGAFAIELLATEELYFDRVRNFWISLAILISSQLIGFGWAGLLQPILVYPEKVHYPDVLPSVALYYSMFSEGEEVKDQLRFFKRAFLWMGFYEIFPTYIAPAFQAISLFCLTLPKTKEITHIFGGAKPFEGLGFLNISADWALVGAHGPFFTPLNAQLHHIAGVLFSLFIFSMVYTNNWFDAGVNQNFPFLSVSLLSSNGTAYPTRSAITQNGTADQTAIEEMGLPFFTSTYVIAQVFASLAAGSAVTHVILHNYDLMIDLFRKDGNQAGIDPHRIICKKYKDFPIWGFLSISVTSIGLALLAANIEYSGISNIGLLVAISLSSILTLAVGFLTAITGFHLQLGGVVQMLGGIMFPGNIFGNMWFTTYGASTVTQSMNMLKDLKLGQYMHLSQTSVVLAQIYGTLIGVFVNLGVMKALVNTQRDVLLLPDGNGVFSGFSIAAFETQSISWGAFSHSLYLINQKYFAIPAALAFGLLLPFPGFIADKIWPDHRYDVINTPLFTGSIASGYSGATAGKLVNIIIGLMSQFWARKFKPKWFHKYNYVCSAALDGGAQVVILLFAIFFQGGDGYKVNFPTYFLNPPESIPKDYCYIQAQ
ncbi:putative oligopeptide transporter [Phakopsora pachyrhizi]|nr:putative oligopeptide transporter [Phakopsora pachyrhizi]